MRWKRTNITNEQGPALKVKLTVEGKDAVKLVKKHFLLFLNLFFFLSGMLGGILFSRNLHQEALSGLDFLFQATVQSRTGSVGTVFAASFASSFLFLFLCFLFGLALWGFLLTPPVLFFRGVGLGVSSGYLYAAYHFKGILFYCVVVLPGALVCGAALILAAREAMRTSRSIGRGEHWNMKLYCVRFGGVLILAAGAALTDAVLSFCLSGLFSF